MSPLLHGRSSISVLDAQLCLGAHCPPRGTGLAARSGAAADPSPRGWDGSWNLPAALDSSGTWLSTVCPLAMAEAALAALQSSFF